MAEERITEVHTPEGNTHTHTMVIEDRGTRGGSGAGWVIAIVLIIAVLGGIYFLSNMSSSQSDRDNAIAGAARDVGSAAEDVGDAAKDAARKVGN